MLRIEFSTEDINALHYERFHHPHPRVQLKMEALFFKSLKLPHQEICRLTRLSPNTLRAYLREYQQGGIEQLRQVNFHQPQSKLMAHQESLEQYFRNNPPASVNQAAAVIAEITGEERSPTRVREFILKLGLRRRKVGSIPAKADLAKQAEFLETQLQPRLDEAENGARAVFFMDAAHFVLAPFLGFLWSFARIFLQAPSGRQRFNVLGALDAVTKQMVTVTNDSYITSVQVCELLNKLAGTGLTVPITVVLDNARYQRCRLVMEHAATLGIELLFLPPYSPNLNLIERYWKFVKKDCLYSKYYDNFDKFKAAITNCLENASTKNQKELNSLLTLKFQTFEKTQFVPV